MAKKNDNLFSIGMAISYDAVVNASNPDVAGLRLARYDKFIIYVNLGIRIINSHEKKKNILMTWFKVPLPLNIKYDKILDLNYESFHSSTSYFHDLGLVIDDTVVFIGGEVSRTLTSYDKNSRYRMMDELLMRLKYTLWETDNNIMEIKTKDGEIIKSIEIWDYISSVYKVELDVIQKYIDILNQVDISDGKFLKKLFKNYSTTRTTNITYKSDIESFLMLDSLERDDDNKVDIKDQFCCLYQKKLSITRFDISSDYLCEMYAKNISTMSSSSYLIHDEICYEYIKRCEPEDSPITEYIYDTNFKLPPKCGFFTTWGLANPRLVSTQILVKRTHSNNFCISILDAPTTNFIQLPQSEIYKYKTQSDEKVFNVTGGVVVSADTVNKFLCEAENNKNLINIPSLNERRIALGFASGLASRMEYNFISDMQERYTDGELVYSYDMMNDNKNLENILCKNNINLLETSLLLQKGFFGKYFDKYDLYCELSESHKTKFIFSMIYCYTRILLIMKGDDGRRSKRLNRSDYELNESEQRKYKSMSLDNWIDEI